MTEDTYIKNLIESGNKVIEYNPKCLKEIYEILENRTQFKSRHKTILKNEFAYYPLDKEGFVIINENKKIISISPTFQRIHEKIVKSLEEVVRE